MEVSIFRGVVFSYSFSIYCAAYHGIWCSVSLKRHVDNDMFLGQECIENVSSLF